MVMCLKQMCLEKEIPDKLMMCYEKVIATLQVKNLPAQYEGAVVVEYRNPILWKISYIISALAVIYV